MLNIGLPEFFALAVVGLLVFGPDRLPKAVADLVRTLRGLKAMADQARQDFTANSGVDMSAAQDLARNVAELHPRRLVSSLFEETPGPSATAAGATPAPEPPPRAAYDPDAT